MVLEWRDDLRVVRRRFCMNLVIRSL